MDSIIYYSFLNRSIAGVPRCWFLHRINSIHIPQGLPLGLKRYFPAENITRWILIRHGYKVWPLLVVGCNIHNDTWTDFCRVHRLRVGLCFFACERHWIFNTFMFNENGHECVTLGRIQLNPYSNCMISQHGSIGKFLCEYTTETSVHLMISVMFVGHLGELPLAGASMATSFASVTGFSLMIGMGSALDTFCGQSYGAKQYHMLGIHMQRAMFVLLLCCIPLSCIWANTASILLFFGQDPEIAAEAGSYARFLIPTIFAYAILQCHIRFLQAQNNVVPMMFSAGITTLFHVFVCWVLVFKSGLGNKGAALANGISYWTNAILLAVYVRVSPSCKKTWTGFSTEALHDVMKFIRLAVPSALMICLEIWSFEMMVLLAGLLPNPKLETSVLSICLNTCSVVYMIPLGLSGATSIRVSNELGAGRPQAARLAVCVVVCMVATEGVIVATVLILGHHVWGYSYSKEEKVVRYVGEMLILLAPSHFLDGLQSVLSGTARGCGWQKIGAFANLGAYYLIGIPIGITLAFVYHFGGKGLWTGIIVALFAQASFLAIITLRTDWEKEAKKASNRVYGSMIPVEACS